MTERGVRVEEEQVLPDLITDLRDGTAHATVNQQLGLHDRSEAGLGACTDGSPWRVTATKGSVEGRGPG
jgi:hypothetical protein